jgi:signal recognition particle receptor subunit beta
MAIIDIERDVIVVRIVYDGPPFSGKTTSVHALAKILDKRDTVFSPQEDPLSKTLYFDWMEYCGGFFKGYSISCQIISVPGQLSLMERRHFLLRTADSVVFVLDASEANPEIALTYFNDLQQLLSPEDHHFVQVIIQANKQDKPKALSALQLKQTLFPDYPNIKIVDSAAIAGKGIRETFVLAVRLALERAEVLMVKGQLDHGHPQIDSGEDLFTQLQKDLFLQTTPLKSEAIPLVESNSAAQTELVATNVAFQSDQNIITEESTQEIDTAYGTENQLEELNSESTALFEQLDNLEDVIVAADSTATLESAKSLPELTEITATLPPTPSDIEFNELPLELVNLFEPLTEFEDPDDEWNEEWVEPLLGTEAFTEEEEEFFNQLIASSQVAEEEIEEDFEEPFYPEAAGTTLANTNQLTEKSIPFEDLDESDATAIADLSLEHPLPTTTEVSESSPPSMYSNSKTFEDLAADDSHIDLSTATNEPFISTAAAIEPPSLLEPPLVKDWMELDDSKPTEALESLPTEPTTTESVVAQAIEPIASTAAAIELPSLPESLAENDVELDDSEVTHLPLMAKEEISTLPILLETTPISTEPALSPKVSLRLVPNETTSTQWIWPPLAGRTWIQTIFHAPTKIVQQSNGIWIIEATNNWSGFSKAEWLYHDIQLAKQALHDHIRMHLQCSPLLSEKRGIVIATDEENWRLWQLVQLETTLATDLFMALQENTMNKLALEVFRCVSHYAEVYLRCAQYPSCLDLNLKNIGSNQERQLVYIGIIDSILPVNERTQAGLLDSIKQLLIEPIQQTKDNLDIAAIVNELEKIDGFGQHYLLEVLIQLFRQFRQ